jgi:hypothetical protein
MDKIAIMATGCSVVLIASAFIISLKSLYRVHSTRGSRITFKNGYEFDTNSDFDDLVKIEKLIDAISYQTKM